MRVPERELDVPAAELCAVADALDLEPLLEAVGDSLDHVRDQRAGETVQRAVLAAVGRPLDEQLAIGLLDLDVPGNPFRELAARTVHGDALRLDGDCDARRNGPWMRASWPVIRPFEVEMIAVPIPPWIRGMWA